MLKFNMGCAANTPLALYAGVDFKVAEVQTLLAEPYRTLLREGRMTPAQVEEAVRKHNNVIEEWRITCASGNSRPALRRSP